MVPVSPSRGPSFRPDRGISFRSNKACCISSAETVLINTDLSKKQGVQARLRIGKHNIGAASNEL